MRLDWLRVRLLLAIPVTVGCGARAPRVQAPDPDEDDRPGTVAVDVANAPITSSVPASTPPATTPERCAGRVDGIFETFCGDPQIHGVCHAHGGLARPDTRTFDKLHVTRRDLDDALRTFRPDPDRTDQYRMAHDGGGCCYSACTILDVTMSPDPALVGKLDGRHRRAFKSIPKPPAGTSAPAARAPGCPAWVKFDRQYLELAGEYRDTCEYVEYVFDPGPGHIRGRPLRAAGREHVAEVIAGDDWTYAIAVDDVDPRTRARLAEHWREAAQMEHASIAAFAKLSLALLAHGAPPELLAATHRAALDEIEHARVAFAIASRYAGRALGPAPFAAAALAAIGSLEELARETFVDGCIGEACAAAEAAHAAERARDPAIAAALRRIAEDETRHAELAWSVLAWCVARDASILARLDVASLATPGALVDGDDLASHSDDLEPHGVPSNAARAEIRAAVADIARACLAALRVPAAA